MNVDGFSQERRGGDHRCIMYLKKKEIFMNQKSGEKPHKF